MNVASSRGCRFCKFWPRGQSRFWPFSPVDRSKPNLALTDDVGSAAGRDEQAGIVFQRHLHRGDAAAETGNPSGGRKFFADALMQKIGAQVDGADPAKAVADLFRSFIIEFFSHGDGDGEAAHGVEYGGDDAAMQAPMLVMANQVGAHGKADLRGRWGERFDLEAKQFVETEFVFKDVAQGGFETGSSTLSR